MKRITQLVGAALAMTIASPPAHSSNLTAGLCLALSAAVSGSHRDAARVLSGADRAISTFDKPIVEAFAKAWRHSGNGTSPIEGVVLILRMADGSYSGREMGVTNERYRFTFPWHPATIAIVHTHPTSSNPKPCDEDIGIADKYGTPVFTITSRGMFVYDPSIKKTKRVMDNLDWLDPSKWNKLVIAKE